MGPMLADAWRSGVVLAGVSAGLLCWHVGGTTDSFGPELRLGDERPRVPPLLERRVEALGNRQRWRLPFPCPLLLPGVPLAEQRCLDGPTFAATLSVKRDPPGMY